MYNQSDKSWIEYTAKASVKSRMIKRIIKAGMSFARNKDIIKTRAAWESLSRRLKIPADMELRSENIAGVSCEWVLPKVSKGKKAIIYLHGGGYVLGSINTARGFALLMAKYTGERVLSVDYRLAPENPYPAALEDAVVVYLKLIDQGTAPSDIILIGDSAGGGLSLATTFALKEKGEPLPGAVVCLSPWTDLAATGESNKSNLKLDPIFGKSGGVIRAADYAGSESLFNPLVSPLYGDYKDFPPMLIHVGTDEVILDDSIRVADKAREAGVKVSLKVWKGMWHVFTAQESLLSEAKQSLKEIAEFVKTIG